MQDAGVVRARPALDVLAWLRQWRGWVAEHSRALNQANFFPRRDSDTGKNLLGALDALVPLLDRGLLDPAAVKDWGWTQPGCSSSHFLRPLVASLATLPPVAARQEVAGAVAAMVAGPPFWEDERTEGPRAALVLLAGALAAPAPWHDLDARCGVVLAASASLNVPEWCRHGYRGTPPPDAGTSAVVGLVRLAVTDEVGAA